LKRCAIVVHLIHSLGEGKRNRVANHSEILIVNREPGRSESRRRCEKKNGEMFVHAERITMKMPSGKAGFL
jgi:hypothetical protein